MIIKPNTSRSSIHFPDIYSRKKLNTLYREIPLKDTVFRTLRKYFCAMANLYGRISLKDAYGIITSQTPSLATEEEFSAFAKIARHECDGYFILSPDDLSPSYTAFSCVFEWELIDRNLLEDNFDLYFKISLKQGNLPYHIPEKAQFLLYADAFYYDETAQSKELQEFLRTRMNLNTGMCSDAYAEILYGIRYLDADIIMIQNRLSQMGICFRSEDTMRCFADLYQNFYDTTRIQCLRGATPAELRPLSVSGIYRDTISLPSTIRKAFENGSITAEDLRDSILTMQFPSEDDRFRLLMDVRNLEFSKNKSTVYAAKNHPCPCGSGKKYKHCCGKR